METGYVRHESSAHLRHLRLRERSPHQHRQRGERVLAVAKRGLLGVRQRAFLQLLGVELEILLSQRPHGVEVVAIVGALQAADVADDAADAVAPECARVRCERGALDSLLGEDVATHERVVVPVSGACEEVVRVEEREILRVRERHLDVRHLDEDGLVGVVTTMGDAPQTHRS